MKFGVVIFPGSNCDQDVIHVLRNVVNAEVVEIWHKMTDLVGFAEEDCIVLPGGFSYGDYLRAGAIARFSPIMSAVVDFANRGGHVLGICNGFQILCESGLLPGALLRNKNQRFICKNVYITAPGGKARLNNLIGERPLKVPIAHAEGRFHASLEVLEGIERNEQVLFRYCDELGIVSETSNPNGSLNGIAGICNLERNVFGMMPHPERASEVSLRNSDGLILFQSLMQSVMEPA